MIRVSDVVFTPASRRDRTTGLLGWLTFVLHDTLKIDGVAVRRTRNGRKALSWPTRRDRAGNKYTIIKPLRDAARVEIERQVFEALGLGAAS